MKYEQSEGYGRLEVGGGGHSRKVTGESASWSVQLVPRASDLKLDQSASLHGFLSHIQLLRCR